MRKLGNQLRATTSFYTPLGTLRTTAIEHTSRPRPPLLNKTEFSSLTTPKRSSTASSFKAPQPPRYLFFFSHTKRPGARTTAPRTVKNDNQVHQDVLHRTAASFQPSRPSNSSSIASSATADAAVEPPPRTPIQTALERGVFIRSS